MEIPSDVAWAMAIRHIGYCGSDTYRKIQDIIDRNPLWFPWEHRYKHVPQEVHKAYYDEKHPPSDKPIKSLWEQMNKKPRKRKKLTEKSLIEMFDEIFTLSEKARKKRIRERNKAKKLWDKYYKQYNLEYRG